MAWPLTQKIDANLLFQMILEIRALLIILKDQDSTGHCGDFVDCSLIQSSVVYLMTTV